MPENERELGNLLALLAELQERSLSGILIEQVGNVLEGAAVVLRNNRLEGILLCVAGGEGAHGVMGTGDAVVMLLLGNTGGLGLGLDVVLVRRLLVHPGRVGLRVLMMSVDVRTWHHLHGRGVVGGGGN